MNKKQAEEDAVKKSKEATHAAGKNTGMSGRDLVRLIYFYPIDPLFLSPTLNREFNLTAPVWVFPHSSRSTPSGLKIPKKKRRRRRRNGIWTSSGNGKKRRMKLRRRKGFDSFSCRMEESSLEFGLCSCIYLVQQALVWSLVKS